MLSLFLTGRKLRVVCRGGVDLIATAAPVVSRRDAPAAAAGDGRGGGSGAVGECGRGRVEAGGGRLAEVGGVGGRRGRRGSRAVVVAPRGSVGGGRSRVGRSPGEAQLRRVWKSGNKPTLKLGVHYCSHKSSHHNSHSGKRNHILPT